MSCTEQERVTAAVLAIKANVAEALHGESTERQLRIVLLRVYELTRWAMGEGTEPPDMAAPRLRSVK